MNFAFVIVVIFFTINHKSDSARILGVIPTPSYSHQVWLQPLWKELSLRGHQLTVLTTNPMNEPNLTNLTEIDTSFSYNVLTDNLLEIINTQNPFKIIELNVKVFSKVIDKQLEHPEVKKLINDPNEKFDLLITEMSGFAPMAFSKRFKCPFIVVFPVNGFNEFHEMIGNPTHPILYPNLLLGEENNLNLFQRIMAVVLDFAFKMFVYFVYIPIDTEVIKKHFNFTCDPREFTDTLSAVFENSEPIFHGVRPVNPIFVQLGGKPMRMPSKPLSKDLQNILNKASNGFVYFSLGSNVNSKDLSNETMNVILDTFRELPYTILWKYELENLPNKSDNVIISKWISQLEVLSKFFSSIAVHLKVIVGHVNLKLFITHGGMQSIDEGISARVPMLGMPFFADQPYNIKKLVNRGCTLSVDYRTLKKEEFKASILEMIHNPTYRNQIKKLADLAEDQPMTGLERAIWWTEYVIRHNGTKHLRSPVLDTPFYQYYLLDVAGVFLQQVVVKTLTKELITKLLDSVINKNFHAWMTLQFRDKLQFKHPNIYEAIVANKLVSTLSSHASMKTFVIAFIVLAIIHLGHSARILGVVATPSYSHQVWLHPLWKELSLRGHQVTVLTTNPINDPTLTNLTEIDTSFSYRVLTDQLLEIINTRNPIKALGMHVKVFSKVIDKQLEHPPVKQLITDPNVKFDLLITELNGLATMGFAKRFNCPYIAVSPMDGFDLPHRMVGNHIHSVLYPNPILAVEDKLNLMQRVITVVTDYVIDLVILFVQIPMDVEVVEKHFGMRFDFIDFARNVSAVLINSDPIFQKPRALNPKFVQVGGTPMRLPSKPLPKNLQTILDKSNDGFIYFSLGSNVNSKDLSNETTKEILDTFKELPYQVLWKYELEDLPNKPNNVIISKWVSQQEVLKHKNLKLFITHGGMQSVSEGRAARVPMLGMPFFADQHFNIKKLVNRGCSLSVEYKTLEKDHFKTIILEMIKNPIYLQRMNELADLSEDQPMSGLELSIWWTEYVIRHNGTDHLKSPVFDLPYYQYYLLDVIAIFSLIFVTIIYIFIVVVRKMRKMVKYLFGEKVKRKNE
ncbi:hypothetical protein FQR65_LT12188 [Abscondita terminalis]|nr:hypothetical protein FQR65_LT12188 [Abscondita terminalis]